MHKLEYDLFNLARRYEQTNPRLAKKLDALSSLSHYYVPDPILPKSTQIAVAEGGSFKEPGGDA
jgi:hypothetical protein